VIEEMMDQHLQNLKDCRVLLIEDKYYIADDLGQRLSAHGAVLLGPVPTLEKALALVQETERIDGAVIDINLRGKRPSRWLTPWRPATCRSVSRRVMPPPLFRIATGTSHGGRSRTIWRNLCRPCRPDSSFLSEGADGMPTVAAEIDATPAARCLLWRSRADVPWAVGR
jgi:hypothetical protein